MDLSSLGSEGKEPPELAQLRLEDFRWRFGKLLKQDGEFAGVTLEIYPRLLPWFKLRFPFLRDEIFAFYKTLGELLQDEQPPEEATPKAEA